MMSQALHITRRGLMTAVAAFAAGAPPCAWASGPVVVGRVSVEIYRTSGCSCCLLWVKHLDRAGFKTRTTDLAMGQLMRMKLDAGLRPDMASCHTAKVAGYTIEGHVPIREIERILREKPAAAGLTVPGMPIGSPGMETGTRRDAYQVFLFRKDGTSEVFAEYASAS